jgi:hypothetical protein
MINVDITDDVLNIGNLTWTPPPKVTDLWELQPPTMQKNLIEAYRSHGRRFITLQTLIAMNPDQNGAVMFYDHLFRQLEHRMVDWLRSQREQNRS